MTRPKITAKQYEVAVAAARKAGGNENQSHLQGRLKVAMKRRPKAAKKSAR